jgi:hypothetical protein
MGLDITMVVIFSLPDVNSIIFLLDFTNYCLLEALEDNGSLVWVDLRCYGAAFPFSSTVKILKIWVFFFFFFFEVNLLNRWPCVFW